MNQKRQLCKHCLYPLRTCVCSAVARVKTRCAIDILQHPSEQKAAKNTARLVTLCISNAQIWQGEADASFTRLRQELSNEQRPIVVVYPSEKSTPLSTLTAKMANFKGDLLDQQQTEQSVSLMRFLFLDGTWKKAFKLWQLNPWLKHYPSVHIEATASQYHIRKAPQAHCLSTLEAVAYCIEQTEHCNVQPLYDCLHKMMASFSEHRPMPHED